MSFRNDGPDIGAYREHVDAAATFLREQLGPVPSVGLILGTEGGAIEEEIDVRATCSYEDIPHFPSSRRLESSEGTVTVGVLNDARVIVLSPPLQLYEGYRPREVVFPVRLLATAQVETLLLSGLAGGLRSELRRGDLMLVSNHINFQGVNPLVGPNVEEWGPRFPDMTDPYDTAFQRAAGNIARRRGVALRKGVLLAIRGPNLGTGAESRMMRRLGADAVGTGIIPEVIAARHMDLRVGAVTVITERYTPQAPEPVSLHDVPEAVDASRPAVRSVLGTLAANVGADNDVA